VRFSAALGLFIAALVPAISGPARADAAAPSEANLQFFESKVRPLLAERCFKCHSTQDGKNKGGLTLDTQAGLLKGGDNGAVVAAGEPAKSRLVEAIRYGNVDLQMPPKQKLSDAQIADLTEWVRRGAPWPAEQSSGVAARPADFDLAKRKAEHWAWQPVKRVDPPAVKDAAWPKSDIDRFVLWKMEEKGLKPAAPADKRTLIRRATLMVTGLPPTPAEVDAFLADSSPNAFERVVDRLLASPRFGERWARHWLDLVRYGESRGHEFDTDIPNAFQYRDYVIRAFNDDVPYDQFVREHIAGDLLPRPRMSRDGELNESVIATGFWFLSEWVHSPVDIRQDEMDRVDNQIDVFAKTFQAMTVGCARCHDHKFDAISTKDYYALAGFLHSSTYRDVRFEYEALNRESVSRIEADAVAVRAQVLKKWVESQRPGIDRVGDYLQAAIASMRGDKNPPADGLDRAVIAQWAKELTAAKKNQWDPLHPLGLLAAEPREASAARVKEVTESTAALWKADCEEATAAWKAAKAKCVVRYVGASDDEKIENGLAFGGGPSLRGDIRLNPNPDALIPFHIQYESAAVAGRAAGVLSGTLYTPSFVISSPKLTMRFAGHGEALIVIDSHRMIAGPLHGVSRQKLDGSAAFRDHTVHLTNYIGQRAHIEFSATPGNQSLSIAGVWQDEKSPASARASFAALNILVDPPPESERELIAHYAREFSHTARSLADIKAGTSDPLFQRLLCDGQDRTGFLSRANEAVAALMKEWRSRHNAAVRDLRSSPTAMAMMDDSPFNERLLIRGNPKTPGEVVPRRFLEALSGPDGMVLADGSGRLELANEMVDSGNPVTSRVIVNRVWHHLFGRGIVASVDNFGVLGDRPTHPELLDFLADEFVKDGWSIKRLIKRIMLSQAWQMSSRDDEASAATDPRNLLLHRANLRRLEGEAIRDQLLFISGRLDEKMFGPSVDTYLTSFMEGRGRPAASGPLDGAGRRSIYQKIRRNFLSPMMLAFDMPQPFNTMGRRSVSNVPAQALILMNDPFVVQQAELWAKRVIADKALATPEQRIERMYQSAFSRPPSDDERLAAIEFLQTQATELGVAGEKWRDDSRVWADLAHVLVNVKEFIYVP
jgi:cytochrome c553